MKFLKNIINFFKAEPKEIKPTPEQGQLWYMSDDIVDRYCSPIVITVVKVVENVVHYVSNYSDNEKEMVIEEFKEKFTSKYPSMI